MGSGEIERTGSRWKGSLTRLSDLKNVGVPIQPPVSFPRGFLPSRRRRQKRDGNTAPIPQTSIRPDENIRSRWFPRWLSTRWSKRNGVQTPRGDEPHRRMHGGVSLRLTPDNARLCECRHRKRSPDPTALCQVFPGPTPESWMSCACAVCSNHLTAKDPRSVVYGVGH